MSRRLVLRENEVTIISVTPVARGLVRPFLVTFVTGALVIAAASRIGIVHRHESVIGLILVAPFAFVALTRTWRWRSHKVHVTNERVIIEGGVLHHYRSAVELRDVFATRIDQRVTERLSRRGLVVLETPAGPVVVGKVRHPGALCRLIDAERNAQPDDVVALDTVFSFDEPDPFAYEMRPHRRPPRRRVE